MKNDWKFQRNSRRTDDQKKLLGALVIPFIVIVLILVILVADRCGRKEPDQESTEAVTTAAVTMSTTAAPEAESGEDAGESDETGVPETADEFSAENFERDSIPEILDLMKQYFSARASADAVAMNQLYGIGEDEISVTELEAQKTRMRSNSKYVTGFQNIATYVKPGTAADTWLVYTIAEIQFRSVKNTAPMIMWCYVTKDAEGNYLLADSNSLPADVLAYVDAAGRSEEVRRLAADVNTRLKTALEEDSDLQQVYGILNSDSPLWVDDEPDTDQDIVILDDEASAGETVESPTENSMENSSENSVGNPAESSAETTAPEGNQSSRSADEAVAGTE